MVAFRTLFTFSTGSLLLLWGTSGAAAQESTFPPSLETAEAIPMAAPAIATTARQARPPATAPMPSPEQPTAHRTVTAPKSTINNVEPPPPVILAQAPMNRARETTVPVLEVPVRQDDSAEMMGADEMKTPELGSDQESAGVENPELGPDQEGSETQTPESVDEPSNQAETLDVDASSKIPGSDASRTIPVAQAPPLEDFRNEALNDLLQEVDNPSVSVPDEAIAVTIDENLGLTLEETIALALERNETLKEAQLRYRRAEAQVQEAIATTYPTLTHQVDLVRSDPAASAIQARSVEADSNATTSLNARLEMNYDIYTGGRRAAQLESADAQLEVASLDIERLTEDIRLAAANNYYALQGADAQVVIEQNSVVDANQSLRDADLLEQAGLGTKFDVLRAEVEVANAQQRLTLAEATQRVSRRRLAQVLSLEPTVEPETIDAIDLAGKWEISLEETLVLALQHRQELRQQLLLREIEDHQKTIALSAVRPQVSLFANYDVLGIFDDGETPADGFSYGARMRWNFFDGRAAGARAKQEQADIEIAENSFANQRNQIRLAVETAYYNLEASEQNITTAAVAVTLAEESLRLARMRFRAGVGTQTDVISAQTGLNTARGNYLQAVTDYNQAFVQLKREVGLGDRILQTET